jgi:putative hydrolase of HD superfamily
MRTGWSLAGVNRTRSESVSEHSYGTAILSLLISKEMIGEGHVVDVAKVTSMALIHDIAEAITSDIPRTAVHLGGQQFVDAKSEAERKAVTQIADNSTTFKDWLENLWADSVNASILESRIVTCADILDMLIHSLSLEKSGVSPQILDKFFTTSYERICQYEIPLVLDIFWILYEEHIENAEQVGIPLERITMS